MESAQPFVILFAWYVPGFLAAWSMSRRGHDPMPWIYAAWIGGALTAVAAALWVWIHGLGSTEPIPRPQSPDGSVPTPSAPRRAP